MRGVPGFCEGLPERQNKEICEKAGTWTDTFKGTETEKECKAVYTWHPAILSQEEYCTESYWNNKEDCESISKWVLSEAAVEAGCLDTLYTIKEECEDNSIWIEGVPAKPAARDQCKSAVASGARVWWSLNCYLRRPERRFLDSLP